MQLLYKRMCAAGLAVLLLVTVLSLFVGDSSLRPEFTVSGFLDGSWFEAYQTYFAETFPLNGLMRADFEKLEGFYNYGE